MKPSDSSSATTSGDTSNWRRIQFRLTQDEDGYPPASGETLWATALGDDPGDLSSLEDSSTIDAVRMAT